MLRKFRKTEAFAILERNNGCIDTYIGSLSPENIRWTLSEAFPWLEKAYMAASAYGDTPAPIGLSEHQYVTSLIDTYLNQIRGQILVRKEDIVNTVLFRERIKQEKEILPTIIDKLNKEGKLFLEKALLGVTAHGVGKKGLRGQRGYESTSV